MDILVSFFQNISWIILILSFVFSLFVLGKSADTIVDIAVVLSLKLKISRLIIGATIISLGTTLPEVCVSVLASLQGNGSIALGNAVGSIICDTALILGLATLIGRIPIEKSLVNRQGWIQLLAGLFLVVGCLGNWSFASSLNFGGHLPQSFGFLSLILLVFYLFFSIHWAKKSSAVTKVQIEANKNLIASPLFNIFGTLAFFCLLLAISSEVLVLSASEIAVRMEVPQSVIAVTLVALGTSIPELVTSLIAVKKGFGEIALGNIIGADILNALLVAGASVAFASDGFVVEKVFFARTFPIMMLALLTLRLGLTFSKGVLHKFVGALLLMIYVFFTFLNIKDFF